MQAKPPLSAISTCPQQESCSGCQYLGETYDLQINRKTAHLRGHLESVGIIFKGAIQILSAGHEGLRDRLDFSWQKGRLGLFEKNSRQVVDIAQCSQLSPDLQEWLIEFRSFKWPVEKASVRLRVGPDQRRGVWLDLANIDIKSLLDEQNLLRSLQEKAFVEIGQRRKVPEWTGSSYKLRDPELNVWFQTWMYDEAVNLFCHVASFTQPSLQANRLIAKQIQEWLRNQSGIRVIEFGSGIGNLTFPTLAAADSLTACEVDRLSLEGLQKTWDHLSQKIKQTCGSLQIHAGDFQKKVAQDFSDFDLILANPPRSGLMGFIDSLEQLQESQRPPFFLYMSCFPESMAKDLARLNKWGYEVSEMSLLDQFPQTEHYEVLTLLQRK